MVAGMWAKAGLLTMLAVGLAGCEGGLGFGAKTDAPPADSNAVLPPDGAPIIGDAAEAAPVAAQAADIPRGEIAAPDLFNKTDKGLWDGRPSLGGTWVAHPDVTEPQRVIIRNTENGKSAVAALFRRERDNPGPAFQMSSDAASKLGLLAGQPTVIEVVALKRPEAPKKAEPAPVATPAVPAPTTETAAPVDPAAATPDEDSPAGIAAAATAAIGATAADPSATTAEAAIDGATDVAAVPVKSAKPLPKPFVEIGYYSQEANATSTVDRLTAEGLLPQIVPTTVKGQPAWRIIVGPASTRDELATLTAKLKAMGFSAAKPVKG